MKHLPRQNLKVEEKLYLKRNFNCEFNGNKDTSTCAGHM